MTPASVHHAPRHASLRRASPASHAGGVRRLRRASPRAMRAEGEERKNNKHVHAGVSATNMQTLVHNTVRWLVCILWQKCFAALLRDSIHSTAGQHGGSPAGSGTAPHSLGGTRRATRKVRTSTRARTTLVLQGHGQQHLERGTDSRPPDRRAVSRAGLVPAPACRAAVAGPGDGARRPRPSPRREKSEGDERDESGDVTPKASSADDHTSVPRPSPMPPKPSGSESPPPERLPGDGPPLPPRPESRPVPPLPACSVPPPHAGSMLKSVRSGAGSGRALSRSRFPDPFPALPQPAPSPPIPASDLAAAEGLARAAPFPPLAGPFPPRAAGLLSGGPPFPTVGAASAGMATEARVWTCRG
jgi:hypothetical protein